MDTENRTKMVAMRRQMLLLVDCEEKYIIERHPPRKVRLQGR